MVIFTPSLNSTSFYQTKQPEHSQINYQKPWNLKNDQLCLNPIRFSGDELPEFPTALIDEIGQSLAYTGKQCGEVGQGLALILDEHRKLISEVLPGETRWILLTEGSPAQEWDREEAPDELDTEVMQKFTSPDKKTEGPQYTFLHKNGARIILSNEPLMLQRINSDHSVVSFNGEQLSPNQKTALYQLYRMLETSYKNGKAIAFIASRDMSYVLENIEKQQLAMISDYQKLKELLAAC